MRFPRQPQSLAFWEKIDANLPDTQQEFTVKEWQSSKYLSSPHATLYLTIQNSGELYNMAKRVFLKIFQVTMYLLYFLHFLSVK